MRLVAGEQYTSARLSSNFLVAVVSAFAHLFLLHKQTFCEMIPEPGIALDDEIN